MLTISTVGSTNTCHPTPDRTTLATMKPNVTDHLTTCEPWGITISGGTKPYSVVLSALGSPVITNVSMGPQDDVFTYPDRADPNSELMGMSIHPVCQALYLTLPCVSASVVDA